MAAALQVVASLSSEKAKGGKASLEATLRLAVRASMDEKVSRHTEVDI